MTLGGAYRRAARVAHRLSRRGRAPEPEFKRVRRELAARWLSGNGIEIGALHHPLAVSPTASVRYVDRLTVPELRKQYPELASNELVEPDVIDDGERLETFADESLDFVIANHFIEHCEDPIGALENMLRVLRPDGVVYLAVPDKRRTFDQPRPLTPLAHLDRDHGDGPEWSRAAHYQEFAQLDGASSTQRGRDLLERNYSIHFHVWTSESFREFLAHCRRAHMLPFELADFVPENDFEFVAILRKGPEASSFDRSARNSHAKSQGNVRAGSRPKP